MPASTWPRISIRTLSVSSNGSRPLQLHSPLSHCSSCHFQYPQTDRGRCNSLTSSAFPGASRSLSVSSNGSRSLQLIELRLRPGALDTFSILKRIEAAATHFDALEPDDLENFQYPQTDRGRCNRAIPGMRAPRLLLSVSSNGSRPLQLKYARSTIAATRPTFSILKRIEAAATQVRAQYNRCDAPNFQYPQTDRGRCNK